MKLIVYDEAVKRRSQISAALEKRRHTVKICGGTGDFMSMVEEWKPNRILLDAETWKKSMAMIRYFGFGKKLEQIPLLFYNAREGFSADIPRTPAQGDHILLKPTTVDDILEKVEQVQ